jgi:hypothetical protein
VITVLANWFARTIAKPAFPGKKELQICSAFQPFSLSAFLLSAFCFSAFQRFSVSF